VSEVYVAPSGHFGPHYRYVVIVDGKVYDEFVSYGWITQSQMFDVAAGYKEGLEGFSH